VPLSLSKLGIPATLRRLQGRGFKDRLLHPHDEWWDRRLGVHTFGFSPAIGTLADADWRGCYVPTAYRDIQRMLRHVRLGPDDVFVDLGSGLGRAVFAARHAGARRAVGVEIDERLAAGAMENLRNSRLGERGIEFFCMGADAYVPRDCSVVFIYNAFGGTSLRAVLANLRADLARSPRALRVVYFNPVLESLLHEAAFLTRTDHWPAGRADHPVSFWQAAA
jgi:SAM-dependent methyltransferase